MRIRNSWTLLTLLVSMIAMSFSGVAGVSPVAHAATWKCTQETHCYTLSEWHMNGCPSECVDGGVADVQTESVDVPEWENEAFVDNEMWVSNHAGGWVESGQTAGNGINCCTMHRFFAAESINELNYYEYLQPGEVSLNQYNDYVIQDLDHTGTWRIYWGFENNNWVEADAYGGYWVHADDLEAGFEGSDDKQPYNQASQALAGVWGSPESWHPWEGAYNKAKFFASPTTCIEQWAGSWPGNSNYHTPC